MVIPYRFSVENLYRVRTVYMAIGKEQCEISGGVFSSLGYVGFRPIYTDSRRTPTEIEPDDSARDNDEYCSQVTLSWGSRSFGTSIGSVRI